MALFVRQAGVWKAVPTSFVRSAGVWKSVVAMWVRSAGVWKSVATAAPPPGPTGPPINPQLFVDESNFISVTWTPGDVTANTKIYRGSAPVLIGTELPGVTSFYTGYATGTFRVSHIKNGIETILVLAGV